MKAKWIIAACLLVMVAVAANATDKPHTVVTGDTLWDISDQYKNDPFYWPSLWSHNPQVHNPHWIYPGETIYFGSDRPSPAPVVREVRLPLVRLTPAPKAVEEGAAGEDAAMAESEAGMLSLSERRAQDYISPERVERLGDVDSPRYAKELYVAEEELEFAVVDGAELKADDMVTLFDDSRPIMHPNTGAHMGYHVDVVGHARIVEIDDGRGRMQITATYDTVSDGYGLMSYREPVVMVEVSEAPLEMDGYVVAGDRPFMLFVEYDAVFLDKGGDDGLKPGMMLSMPISEEPSISEGFGFSLSRPLATVVVVSTEAATSTAFIIDSDRAVLAGQRFVASADSP